MTRAVKPREQRRAAYHEAGHAVARVALGQAATRTEIHAEGSGASHGSGETYRGRYEIETLILVSLAGPYAEARAARSAARRVWRNGGRSDIACAKELIAGAGPFAWALAEYWQLAGELIREHWPAVERVAQALLERGELDSATVADLAGHDLPRRERLVPDRAELHCTGASNVCLPR